MSQSLASPSTLPTNEASPEILPLAPPAPSSKSAQPGAQSAAPAGHEIDRILSLLLSIQKISYEDAEVLRKAVPYGSFRRYCPQGHDKQGNSYKNGVCRQCALDRSSRKWEEHVAARGYPTRTYTPRRHSIRRQPVN
jgi:hypothetical protein